MSFFKRKNLPLIAVFSAAFVGTACGGVKGGGAGQQSGTARVAAALRGVAPGQIDHVTVTIVGNALPSLRTVNLSRPDPMDETRYAGTVAALPAASGYTFLAEAFGSSGSVLYRGRASDVTISAGQTAQVTLAMQEVDPSPGPVARVPVIEGLSASSAAVGPGAQVHLSLTARSPEGHALAYQWQSSCGGAFANRAEASTDWTAPETSGVCQLSVRVADGANATAVTGYLAITVQAATGGATVEVSVNTYPVILLTVEEHVVTNEPAPDGFSVGITADLDASGSSPDPDGDRLSFLWTSDCGGSFEPSSTAPVVRFHHDDPAAQCTLTLLASDGRGGVTTATVELAGVDTGPATSFTVGGTISGLSGSGLVLATPGQPDLAVTAGAAKFAFANRVASGTAYAVKVLQQPSSPAQLCTVTEGAGTVGTSDVTAVAVTCQAGSGAIATGGLHTCAIVNGGVQCWGNNANGQLGYATTATCGENGYVNPCSTEPSPVSGLPSGVHAIAAGEWHTCALVNGGVWCWGSNDQGQLGNGSHGYEPVLVPVQVSGLASGVQAISAGGAHTCALVDGGVRCWGGNRLGQLGDESLCDEEYGCSDRDVPVQVHGLPDGVQVIACGYEYTCALVDGGAVWCWGSDSAGQLGNDSSHDNGWSFRPVPSYPTSGAQAIAAGSCHTCAIVDGGARCWGGCDADGFLIPELTSGVRAISAGNSYTCAIVNGGAQCGGDNRFGQTGADPTVTRWGNAVQVPGLTNGVEVIAAAAAGGHTCVIVDGGVRCWGWNGYGQLGNHSTTNSHVPVPVVFSP